MSKCQWPGCLIEFKQKKRGRPRKYCDLHKDDAHRKTDREARRVKRAEAKALISVTG